MVDDSAASTDDSSWMTPDSEAEDKCDDAAKTQPSSSSHQIPVDQLVAASCASKLPTGSTVQPAVASRFFLILLIVQS